MAKVSAKLVVGVVAGLGVLTGGGIWVNRILMAGSVSAQAQTPQYSQPSQDMSGMMPHNRSGSDMSDIMEHGNMNTGQTGQKATAQLRVKDPVLPGQSSPLLINIRDAQGNPVKNFQITQEKLMHLIVVSNDLGFFEHIHPTFTGNGRFEISTALPQTGAYTLFSDFQPVGMSHQVTALPLQVVKGSTAANAKVNTKVDLARDKTFGKTRVNLDLSDPTSQSAEPTTPVAGKEVKLSFDLKDAATGRPVSNLQPYLGVGGHLVILRQSPRLTAQSYIHAHALPLWNTNRSSSTVTEEHSAQAQFATVTSSAPGQVNFLVNFPQAGRYKLWGQFNRGGQVMTADFWVNVDS